MTRASNLAIFASSPPTVNSSLLTIGANVSVNTTTFFVGNSTVNTTYSSSLIKVANSTAIANLTATSLNIGSSTVNTSAFVVGSSTVNSTSLAVGANVIVSSTGLLVGNSSVNTNITAGSFTQTGDMGIGTTSPSSYYGQFVVYGNPNSWQANFVSSATAQYAGAYMGLTLSNASTNYGQTVLGLSFNAGPSDTTDTIFQIQQRTTGSAFVNTMYAIYYKNQFQTWYTSGVERMRVSNTGGFSVGTTANPGAGAIYATGNITAYYSDERLKENITPINNALAKVNSITGVTYNSNDLAAEYGFTDRSQQVGVLAQEIQRILPEAVKHAPFDMADAEDGTSYSKSGETYLTVQYDKLVPLLIEAIKELTARVEELESK